MSVAVAGLLLASIPAGASVRPVVARAVAALTEYRSDPSETRRGALRACGAELRAVVGQRSAPGADYMPVIDGETWETACAAEAVRHLVVAAEVDRPWGDPAYYASLALGGGRVIDAAERVLTAAGVPACEVPIAAQLIVERMPVPDALAAAALLALPAA